MTPDLRPTKLLPAVLFGVLVLSSSSQASRTLMFLVDWWLSQPMDTVIGLSVTQPASEIKYQGTGGLPVPQKTNAYVDPNYEKFAWWYSLSNFNADDYSMGRIRLNATYQRGWYQTDGTLIPTKDTLLNLVQMHMDTFKRITYRNPTTQRDTTVAVTPATATTPPTVLLPAGATLRTAKLYTSNGNGGTPLLNQRPGDTLPGAIDKCIDGLVGDTVWIRFMPAGQQQPTESQMKCTNYNPFAVLRARVYLRSPWPGANPTVEWNNQQVQMYPWPNNPDWMVADLRYLPPLGKPALSFRFHKASVSSEYFDSSGVNSGAVLPFSYPTAADGLSYWYVPPEGGGPMISKSGSSSATPPLTAPYTLYVQNPWSPGTPRVAWINDPYLRVMRPSKYCGYYQYPLYTKPTQMLIGHSFTDSVFGTAGVQFRDRTSNVVTLVPRDSAFWVMTFAGATTVRTTAQATASPTIKTCSSDTLRLVMDAFDFKGRGETGGNPSFQVGGLADADGKIASSGLVTGMVQTNLRNGLPVYTGKDSGTWQPGGINGQAKGIVGGPYGKSTPSNWFDSTALRAAVPGIAIGHTCLELPLAKSQADSGYYKFQDTSFFPLDTITDRRGYSPYTARDGKSHNFLFCLHGHAAFEYTPGLKFDFRGDDDVWVFINSTLAVDVGGTHAAVAKSANIDKLHLVEGQVYPFDIFYCERQTNGSSILIRTSLDLQPSWQYKDTLVSRAGGVVSIQIKGLMSQNYRPSCAELAKAPTWQNASGRMVVVGPDGSNLYDAYSADANLYGGFLTYINGLVRADTVNLINQPDLSWPGKYKILIQSPVGDPLDSITFTKAYGAVVVQGTVLDADGDGVADSVQLVAPMPILKDAPVYHMAWFKSSGAKDSIPSATGVNKISDSIATVSISGKAWGIRTAFPAGVRQDSLNAVVTTQGGKQILNPIHLIDGIAPVADSAWLIYDTAGTGSDTLFVRTSEVVVANPGAVLPAVAGWVLVGRSSSPRIVAQAGAIQPSGTVIKFTFPSGTAPASLGDSLRLGGMISDAIGNAPGARSRWVPIAANAVAKSWMMDKNGDGRPDFVGIGATGDFTTATSVNIHWKTAAGADTIVTLPVTGGLGTSLQIPGGILQNATYCSGCFIEVGMTGGVVRRFPLYDSVPAAATQAEYHYGKIFDTLIVTASEALAQGFAVGEGWVAQKAAGSASIPGTIVAGTLLGSAGQSIVLLVPPGTFSADSIRLRGWSQDAFQNVPGTVSPWVLVSYGSQPIRVQIYDRNGDGLADSVVYRLTRGSKSNMAPSSFGLTWGGVTLPAAGLPQSADGLSWSGAIGPFPLATQASVGDAGWLATATDPGSNRADVEDSVAPVAMTARLTYGGGQGRLDTLDIVGSEDLLPGAAISLVLLNSDSGEVGAITPAAGKIRWYGLTAPNTIRLLLDSGTVPENVLWARLGIGVTDANGNAVKVNSRWVPITFGLRLIIRQINPMVQNWGANAWPEPPVGTSPTEFQVRQDGASNTWLKFDEQVVPTIDGTGKVVSGIPANPDDSSKVMAVYLRLNRPLEGDLFIYDNMGTGVLRRSLAPLVALWPNGMESTLREVKITWNGTDPKGKFVASGVYLMRVVVKVDMGDGKIAYRNLIWKYGWMRPTKD